MDDIADSYKKCGVKKTAFFYVSPKALVRKILMIDIDFTYETNIIYFEVLSISSLH